VALAVGLERHRQLKWIEPGGLDDFPQGRSQVEVHRWFTLVLALVVLEFGFGFAPRFGDPLEEALRDMPWVGDIAVAHESVVEHLSRARATTVIPMKLFTMFSTADRAVASVKSRRKELAAVAARVRGCAEWGVRVTKRATSGSRSARTARAASGADFLAAKKRARDDAREAVALALDAAEQALKTLAAVARATHRRDTEPEGVVTPPLLDAAFLVPASRRAKFKAAARRAAADCAGAGAEMTLTGPWPPYNFVQRGDGS